MSNIDRASYNRLGQLFTAANQAAATVTLINTSTATGLIVYNPWGSGKKLVLCDACFTYTTAPTAIATPWLAMSIKPSAVPLSGLTAVDVYASNGSGVSSIAAGKAASAATTPVLPVYTQQLGNALVTVAGTSPATWQVQLDGSLILVPGSFIQISYIGQAPVGQGSMSWIEVSE